MVKTIINPNTIEIQAFFIVMLLIIDMNVIKKAFSFHKFNKCLIKIIDNEVSFSRQADNFEKRKFMIFVNSTM